MFFPVDMNAAQSLGHVFYAEHAIKELETKCAVYSIVTICQTVFISRISSPTPYFLWERNFVLYLTIHNLYIHDLGDPKWGTTIDRPPGSAPAPEADILLAKKW